MTKTAEVGAFEFDPDTGELRDASGGIICLRPQTAHVLAVLLSRRGELVSKTALMETVWPDTFVTDDSLVQCISEIRKALGPTDAKLLKTVPKQGYRLSAETGLSSPLAGWTARPHRISVVAGTAFAAVLLAVAALVWWGRAPSEHEAPRIAVLPFINTNADGTNDYFSDGLSEDLLTDLSKIRAINVFSRTTSFVYRKRSGGVREIADELGANYLIDGSVRRDGDRVRITVELVDGKTGASLWAERYDRELGEIFALQDEVRAKIISALAIRLAPDDEKKFLARGTHAIAAYELLLKGRHEESAMSREGITKAISYFEQAKAADPNYGEAYARLANMYDFTGRFGWSDDKSRDRLRSLEMAEAAVRLDPQNPFTHWTYGRVLARWENGSAQYRQQAFEELKRAIELDPNYADAYAFLSQLYIGSGLPDLARQAMDKATSLNPSSPSWYAFTRGIISYMDGDFEQAVSNLKQSLEMNPTASFVHLWLAAAYARAGLQDDAEWQLEEAKALGSPQTISSALSTNPIVQHPKYVESYLKGLRLAGLDE